MDIKEWWNFFYLCGSASASLMGLTIVAVSLGKSLIKKDNLHRVSAFIAPAFFHFLHVFLLCCLTAVPEQTGPVLAAGMILSAGWRLSKLPTAVSVIRVADRENMEPTSKVDTADWLLMIVLPAAIYLTLIGSGTGFLYNQSWSTPALALCCFALFLVASRSAWDMFIWIAATLPDEPEAELAPRSKAP